VICEIKAGPLPLCNVQGRPNLGMISFRKAFAILEALSVEVGKASNHYVKVSIKTSNCL
jgi:hypothetical protein